MIWFDVDDVDDYDLQTSGPPCPLLGQAAEVPDEEIPEEEDFISGTVAAVVMRELADLGAARAYSLEVEGGYLFFMCEDGPVGPVPFVGMEASWVAWEEMLYHVLERARYVWVPPMDAPPLQQARRDISLLAQELSTDLSEPARGEALAALERVESLSDRMISYRREADSDAVDGLELSEAEYMAELEELVARVQNEFEVLVDVLQRDGRSDLADRLQDSSVYEIASAAAYHFRRLEFPAVADSMHWQGLSAENQVQVVLKLDEEHLHPSSFLSAVLIQQHPGTLPETQAALALTNLWEELAEFRRD